MRDVTILALGLVFVAGCIPGGNDTAVKDLSDFESFQFAQTPALGFCPSLTDPLRAAINRSDNGEYVLSMSILELRASAEDVCLERVEQGLQVPLECTKETILDDRVLAADEISNILEVFSEITVMGPAPVCFIAFIDPCRISEYSWDTFNVTDFLCSDTNIQDDSILSLLRELRTEPLE